MVISKVVPAKIEDRRRYFLVRRNERLQEEVMEGRNRKRRNPEKIKERTKPATSFIT